MLTHYDLGHAISFRQVWRSFTAGRDQRRAEPDAVALEVDIHHRAASVTDDPEVRATGRGRFPMPGFWLSQRGPHPESAVEAEDRRCIGEIVCPSVQCNKVLARLYDSAEGIDVRAWAPATPIPGSQQHGPLGWTMCAVIGEDVPDAATERLHCWREHLDLELSAGLCREVAEVYRGRGSKVRRPAAAYTEGDN